MRTELRKSLVGLAAPFILAGLLSGCDRVGLFDMAKNGVDVVYAMGTTVNTQLYIARPDYYKQYDIMTIISPVRMATSGRAVFVYSGSSIYTNQESFDSWGPLNDPTPLTPAVDFMTSQNDEVLALDVGTQTMYRLHEDSFQEADAYTDQTDLADKLGSFNPVFMFKSHNSDAVYLIAANGIVEVGIFSVNGGDLNLIGTNTTIAAIGPIVSAGRKGNIFYMLGSGGIIYRMDISSSGALYTYAPISATSMAVTESKRGHESLQV